MSIWTGVKYCDRLKCWILPILPSATKFANVGQLTRAVSACFALKSYDSNASSLLSNIKMPALTSIHSLSSWWKSMLIAHMRKRCRTTSHQRHRGRKQQTLSKCQHHRDGYNRDNNNNNNHKSRSKRSTLHGYALLASAAGLFSWDEHRITDEELLRLEAKNKSEWNAFYDNTAQNSDEDDWEIVMDQIDFKIWRKVVPGSSIYQYKVIGSYKDISANQFYATQRNLDYRREWDTSVVKLEVYDRDPEGSSELVYWESYYPFPLSNRDYVYVRRGLIDEASNTMTILSKSVCHPDFEENSSVVRGSAYNSVMIIKPHSKFNKPGLDYLLIYFDDPRGYIPSYCLSWAASSAVPSFMKLLHAAALKHNTCYHPVVSPQQQS